MHHCATAQLPALTYILYSPCGDREELLAWWWVRVRRRDSFWCRPFSLTSFAGWVQYGQMHSSSSPEGLAPTVSSRLRPRSLAPGRCRVCSTAPTHRLRTGRTAGGQGRARGGTAQVPRARERRKEDRGWSLRRDSTDTRRVVPPTHPRTGTIRS